MSRRLARVSARCVLLELHLAQVVERLRYGGTLTQYDRNFGVHLARQLRREIRA